MSCRHLHLPWIGAVVLCLIAFVSCKLPTPTEPIVPLMSKGKHVSSEAEFKETMSDESKSKHTNSAKTAVLRAYGILSKYANNGSQAEVNDESSTGEATYPTGTKLHNEDLTEIQETVHKDRKRITSILRKSNLSQRISRLLGEKDGHIENSQKEKQMTVS